jgi:hypothetical protein
VQLRCFNNLAYVIVTVTAYGDVNERLRITQRPAIDSNANHFEYPVLLNTVELSFPVSHKTIYVPITKTSRLNLFRKIAVYSRRLRWAGHVARRERVECTQDFSGERDHLEVRTVDGKTILK